MKNQTKNKFTDKKRKNNTKNKQHNTKKIKNNIKKRNLKAGNISIKDISIEELSNKLLEHNLYLDILNIYDDPYVDNIPLSYDNKKGVSVMLTNNTDEDIPIAILRIFFYKDSDQVAEIGDIFLNPKFTGQMSPLNIKWSHLIFKIGLKEAKKRNFNVVWLWTIEDNIPAIKLYKFFEFEQFNYTKLSESIKSKHKWIGKKNIVMFLKKI